MSNHASILCLAVTPAVQRTQFFATFQPGEVNRIRRTIVTASGKGVNVALGLKLLGVGSPACSGSAEATASGLLPWRCSDSDHRALDRGTRTRRGTAIH